MQEQDEWTAKIYKIIYKKERIGEELLTKKGRKDVIHIES
jgi:hypothetical protein